MRTRFSENTRGSAATALLLGLVALTGGGLTAWKYSALRANEVAAANQPEPVEAITATVATDRPYRPTTTSVGTVLALRSVTLRNELAGTVRRVSLIPGQIVSEGAVLVALDVTVEEATSSTVRARANFRSRPSIACESPCRSDR